MLRRGKKLGALEPKEPVNFSKSFFDKNWIPDSETQNGGEK